MNKVVLIGRLVRDSEMRYSANNMAVLRNTVAVDRRGRAQEGQQTADFIPITAFGKTAEFIQNYFSKGSKIAITGRIQTGSYDNAEGRKVYTTDVIVEEVEFVESKRNDGQANAGYARPAQEMPATPAPAAAPMSAPAASDGYFPIDDDGDIPF